MSKEVPEYKKWQNRFIFRLKAYHETGDISFESEDHKRQAEEMLLSAAHQAWENLSQDQLTIDKQKLMDIIYKLYVEHYRKWKERDDL